MNDFSFTQVRSGEHYIQAAWLGDGPLVIFCHGFPGLWYSWRHQMRAGAAAGFKAVAPGYEGLRRQQKPANANEYTLDNIRSDLRAVLETFGQQQAVFVGADFGAAVVWNMALAEPDLVRALVVLSVPYDHDYYGYFGQGGRGLSGEPPSKRFADIGRASFLHAHYFQEPGIAEQELNAQPREFLTRLFWALSAQGDLRSAFDRGKPEWATWRSLVRLARPLPWAWMSETDMDYYAQQFGAGGFTGPLNWGIARATSIGYPIASLLDSLSINPACSSREGMTR
ncbi:MAG: alpha/beta fold hydrolase [Haliea sp.]|nr:alpha/beta fold hydrolase [Haliea sp.]